tara:strand:- start:561 stop:839 length:279 start_codon:yes stop_codon:yes gene_type:complete
MRRANFLRTKQSERAPEAASFQVLKDAIEAERKVARDVFKEQPLGLKSSDCVEDVGPQMTRVFSPHSFAGCTEGLARVSACNPVDGRKFAEG